MWRAAPTATTGTRSGSGRRYSHQSFLHYHSCKNDNDDGSYFRHFWGAVACHRVSHVVRMDDYFQSTRGCVEDYCGGCMDACDGGEGYCDSRCLSNCESYYNATE